jgi:hypothetical protein
MMMKNMRLLPILRTGLFRVIAGLVFHLVSVSGKESDVLRIEQGRYPDARQRHIAVQQDPSGERQAAVYLHNLQAIRGGT